MNGLHLTADCRGCACAPSLLTDQGALRSALREAALRSGMSVVAEAFHQFLDPCGANAGVTGALILAESHCAAHTWPELGAVTLDVYVCNFQTDNSQKARAMLAHLLAAFQPASVERGSIDRGESPLGGSGLIHHEPLAPGVSLRLELSEARDVSTATQRAVVARSELFGATLLLDGALMTSERDERFYHEALIHPAACAHPRPERALIIGGGDGGSSKQLLKHSCLKSLTVCEIDPEIALVCQRAIPAIGEGALLDPRVALIHDDGLAFVQRASAAYDLIYLDLTDPVSPDGSALAAGCYTPAFFESCKRALRPGGAIALHLGSPFYHPERFASQMSALRASFAHARAYTAFCPLYGSDWGMAVASDQLDAMALGKAEIKRRLSERSVGGLQLYTPGLHGALFELPAYALSLALGRPV